jgi:hypothetical protein
MDQNQGRVCTHLLVASLPAHTPRLSAHVCMRHACKYWRTGLCAQHNAYVAGGGGGGQRQLRLSYGTNRVPMGLVTMGVSVSVDY